MMVDILNCLGSGYLEDAAVYILNCLGFGYLEDDGGCIKMFRVWIS